MDLIRDYYAVENMTASPFRLEYIYQYTSGPNLMRKFLVSTAAFRSLAEKSVEGTAADGSVEYLSTSMKSMITKNGDFCVDFVDSLVRLYRLALPDPRHGIACA